MLEAVKFLVDAGVDVNAENPEGRRALDAATTLKFESVVAFLKEHGATPGKQQKPDSPTPRS
jgi:ankyrin repeat protein